MPHFSGALTAVRGRPKRATLPKPTLCGAAKEKQAMRPRLSRGAPIEASAAGRNGTTFDADALVGEPS
jgi:hypothetical protein